MSSAAASVAVASAVGVVSSRRLSAYAASSVVAPWAALPLSSPTSASIARALNAFCISACFVAVRCAVDLDPAAMATAEVPSSAATTARAMVAFFALMFIVVFMLAPPSFARRSISTDYILGGRDRPNPSLNCQQSVKELSQSPRSLHLRPPARGGYCAWAGKYSFLGTRSSGIEHWLAAQEGPCGSARQESLSGASSHLHRLGRARDKSPASGIASHRVFVDVNSRSVLGVHIYKNAKSKVKKGQLARVIVRKVL